VDCISGTVLYLASTFFSLSSTPPPLLLIFDGPPAEVDGPPAEVEDSPPLLPPPLLKALLLALLLVLLLVLLLPPALLGLLVFTLPLGASFNGGETLGLAMNLAVTDCGFCDSCWGGEGGGDSGSCDSRWGGGRGEGSEIGLERRFSLPYACISNGTKLP